MEDILSISTQANKAYALNSFEEAADLYAKAYEKLVELNGADSFENANTMLLYGRTLVKLALQKSEVLAGGGTAPLQERPANEENAAAAAPSDAKFSFSGDGADEDDEDEGFEDVEQPSVEDEFQDAWEVLDLARVLFEKKLEEMEIGDEKQETKKRLAEIYDLLGEISLENENFDQAVSDLKIALALKQELYDSISSQVSGAHYMLALALEYCTSEESRNEAVSEVEHAITSFEGRIKTLDNDSPKYKDESEMLDELKLKLADLQSSKSDLTSEVVKEVFRGEGSALKESVIQAMQSSNDLSSLVRKKEKKRPAGESVAHVESKKAKVENEAEQS